MNKILIIEDETAIAELEKDYLELSNFEVTICNDGLEGSKLALNEDFDLILLDLMLPNMDGFEICKLIRDKKNTPIIMVSAKKDDIDKIHGLGLGADDYIVKPFGVKEVCARVRAVLRRTENQVAPQQEEKIKGGDITVDIVSHTVTKGDKSIELTAKEFDLLVMLMRNSGRVLTRDTLLDRVWGVEYFGDTRTVDVHVRYLRQKIEDNPDTPQLLQTVRGVGYKFVGE